jgi:4'-phosphopantetheinyl transferase EntD
MARSAEDRALPVVAVAAPEPGSPCGLSWQECRACSMLPETRRADWRASRLAASAARAAASAIPGCRPSSSLSHRDGRGAAAVDPAGRPLGIDIERADAVAPGTERYFLSGGERHALEALGASALWSLKEAAWKALLCDDYTPFHALRLVFDAEFRLVALELNGRTVPARAELSNPWPGYVLAVVVLEGKP